MRRVPFLVQDTVGQLADRVQGFPEHLLQHNKVDGCDRCFLEWLGVRIANRYHENPGIDFLLRLRRIATKLLVKS
jgi:hypothetical protein